MSRMCVAFLLMVALLLPTTTFCQLDYAKNSTWSMNNTYFLTSLSETRFSVLTGSIIAFVFVLLVGVCIVSSFACGGQSLAAKQVKQHLVCEQTQAHKRSVSPVSGRWKRLFDMMFVERSEKVPPESLPVVRSLLNVPIDMALEMDVELDDQPMPRAVQVEERTEHAEAELYDAPEPLKMMPRRAMDVAQKSSLKRIGDDIDTLQREESEGRGELHLKERQRRLAWSKREREAWRNAMSRRAAVLHEKIESSPKSKARRAQLLQSRQSVLAHIQHSIPHAVTDKTDSGVHA